MTTQVHTWIIQTHNQMLSQITIRRTNELNVTQVTMSQFLRIC